MQVEKAQDPVWSQRFKGVVFQVTRGAQQQHQALLMVLLPQAASQKVI
jgi:hypothetical protein